MKKFDPKTFDERVAKCPKKTRVLVAFLKTVAENAGENVSGPTFEKNGGGITYWIGSRRFCRFDPKHEADHVGVLIPGGDRNALNDAGEVSAREDGPWVFVGNIRGAVRLVPEILGAYDRLRNRPSVGAKVGRMASSVIGARYLATVNRDR